MIMTAKYIAVMCRPAPCTCISIEIPCRLAMFHHDRDYLFIYRDAVWCSTAYAFGNRLATFHHDR